MKIKTKNCREKRKIRGKNAKERGLKKKERKKYINFSATINMNCDILLSFSEFLSRYCVNDLIFRIQPLMTAMKYNLPLDI